MPTTGDSRGVGSSGGDPGDAVTECFALQIEIPDGDRVGVTADLPVPTAVTIGDLDVRVRVFHGQASPLGIQLGREGQNPSILTPGDEGCDEPIDGTYVFDDEADNDLSTWCQMNAVPVAPQDPLSVHDGSSSEGTWQITVVDPVAGGRGTLSDVCLTFTP